MITRLLISSILGAIVVVTAEGLRIKKFISNETSRKVIHIAHGLVVAAWVFITSYTFIIAAELLFLLVVSVARYFKIMQPLRNVKRRSWGEFFFPIAVIIMALFSPPQLVFAAAMLHLGLADALATLVGRRFKTGIYYVLGHRKSIAGTAVFMATSLLIILWFIRFSPAGHSILYPLAVMLIPIAAALVENISPYGSDNLTIPLVVLVALSIT